MFFSKHKKLIFLGLTILGFIFAYPSYFKMRVQQEINKLVYINGKPIAEYELFINLGRECGPYSKVKGGSIYRIQPKNIPVWQFIKESFAVRSCDRYGKAPHMELTIYQGENKKTYQAPKGEVTRHEHNFWSFFQGRFVHFIYWQPGIGIGSKDTPSYEDFMANFSPLNQKFSEAVANNNIELAKELLEKGADVNGSNSFFTDTPLMRASMDGNVAMVELLLSYHPSLKPKDPSDYPAFILAYRYEHQDVADLLDAYISKNMDKSDPEVIEIYADALQTSISSGSLDMLKDIIQKNEHLTLKHRSEALKYAALRNSPFTNQQLEAVQFLINNGGDINYAFGDYQYPILLSIVLDYCGRNFDMIKLLVENGADIQAERQGRTALTVASECNNKDLANYLQTALDASKP